MRFSLFLLMLCAGAADARGAGFEAAGYLKNLYHYTRARTTRAPYWSDLSRARVRLDAKLPLAPGANEWAPPRHSLRAHVEYDHEISAGTFLKSRDYQLAGFGEPPTHFRMEQRVSSGTDGYWRHRLYRGWVELASFDAHLRFGRQRIAWGTGKLWNPTDFLNPYTPTSLERDERRGVDAVYLRRGAGTYGQGEAVYVIGGRWSETDLVGRARGHIGQIDASLSGGKVAGSTGSWTVGGDVAADVGGGSLHGEWSRTDLILRDPFWKVMAGYEYTFPADPAWAPLKDMWIVGEYFHNGSGESAPRRYDRGPLLSGREVTLGRDYVGLGLTKDMHPLVKVELYAIANLNDRSHFFNPSISWNARRNLHLLGGWQRFGGKLLSEYGPIANVTYAQVQYFF